VTYFDGVPPVGAQRSLAFGKLHDFIADKVSIVSLFFASSGGMMPSRWPRSWWFELPSRAYVWWR